MNATNNRGRRHRPYKASTGEYLTGLARLPDGRWRLLATGERFVGDEAKAIRKLRAITSAKDTVFVPFSEPSFDPPLAPELSDDVADLQIIEHDDDSMQIGWNVNRRAAFQWFAEQLAKNPREVAQLTGIASLAAYETLGLSLDMP